MLGSNKRPFPGRPQDSLSALQNGGWPSAVCILVSLGRHGSLGRRVEVRCKCFSVLGHARRWIHIGYTHLMGLQWPEGSPTHLTCAQKGRNWSSCTGSQTWLRHPNQFWLKTECNPVSYPRVQVVPDEGRDHESGCNGREGVFREISSRIGLSSRETMYLSHGLFAWFWILILPVFSSDMSTLFHFPKPQFPYL